MFSLRLPRALDVALESWSLALMQERTPRRVDFSLPAGEAALVAPDSVSWRVFKNPVALLVGGITAVILELAEPAVRTGVWEHSSFRRDPLGRLRRTGLAAMVTVYGARSVALPMIVGVAGMHARVFGETPSGRRFAANEPRLLDWVHATAGYGFSEAYDRYVAALTVDQFDAFCAESVPAARLYGAVGAPTSRTALRGLFAAMEQSLEGSAIVFEFLRIMHATRALPAALRRLQPLMVRAAVDLVPDNVRARLDLTAGHGLRGPERSIVRLAGAIADRIVPPSGPPAQSCRRLGLPTNYLYR